MTINVYLHSEEKKDHLFKISKDQKDMITDLSFGDITELIGSAHSALITTHINARIKQITKQIEKKEKVDKK